MGQGQRLPSLLYSRCGEKASHNVGKREKNGGQFGTIDAASPREKNKNKRFHCAVFGDRIRSGKRSCPQSKIQGVQFGRLASQVEGLDFLSWRVELVCRMAVA